MFRFYTTISVFNVHNKLKEWNVKLTNLKVNTKIMIKLTVQKVDAA